MRIDTLDLDFQGSPQTIAAYVVRDGAGPVLVETGPGSTVPALVAGLARLGFEPGDVRHVLVTHIHLDHAGAAGWWSGQGATVYVHEVGAPHLVDPSRLIASAARIYGDRMESLWGEILAVAAERVVALADGDTVEAEGLRFEALATPGHASHHHVYRLGDVAFTGDAAGMRVPGAGWADLPAPPPEFDLEAWKRTLERLRRLRLRRIYPTHFGPCDAVAEQLDELERRLEESVAYVRSLLELGLERDEMVRRYDAWVSGQAAAAGVSAAVLRRIEVPNPREMSLDGIARYLRKRQQAAPRTG